MKKIIFMSLFTFLCSLFGCAQSTDYPFESVGVDEFEEIIADTSVVRLDVRRSEESPYRNCRKTKPSHCIAEVATVARKLQGFLQKKDTKWWN